MSTTPSYEERFASIQRLYGQHAQTHIQSLHICIVGLGGVGSWSAESLARTGIGQLTLIDFDVIRPSNINRQIHSLDNTLEQKKNAALADRIRLINPQCQVNVIDDFLTLRNLEDYLALDRGYHHAIDAIDSIKFKSALIHHCKRNKIPLVTTGGAGGTTDPAMVKVDDLSKTHNDPLASKVRSTLRSRYGFSRNLKRSFGIPCVYSSQQRLYPKEDGSVSHEKPGIHGVSLDCRFGYGSVSFVTATFGLFAAALAVNRSLHRLQQP